ncbi:FAD-dependent oxidoreductase [Paenibacillus validus]|uniref:Ferredoxin reductase n=1 Tax=Paenibacillus validus TaxID=44253 RepID=A0A7X3CTX6_9BACL|nr:MULTISPECIES: FAD-dependent oxidoreductase [Paenibacillus]MED4601401.1 FAD-dependent oxidoreductase [Paenibacillus validus]MED4605054.1 FAD-dependent oxidoreductase [Paenibacillus validus]MUG72907.1 ferredoxin reductase [Paenibacillus validus]
MNEAGMVIIGAGEAGARAAVELRTQGWSGPITLIGEEKHAPYERPPLSKNLLLGEDEPSPIFILNDEKLLQHDITFLSGCMAVEIDRNNRAVILEDGRQLPYDRLLLATGARPRKYALEGSENADVLYLRTFSDALSLRSRLQPGTHVAVIGGGFIGLEAAASAVERGCTVSLIELGPRILTRGVPKEIADIVEARHRAAGVDFKLGVTIDSIANNGGRQAIVLADGTSIECDSIIIGIGAVPEITLAAGCGLEIENGIRVDERLQTSDPYIFAAGDCCSFPHALYDGRRIRLESWRNAQDQGSLAARNMMGAGEAYTVVPWFWSDQYEQTLQVAGLTDFGEIMVSRNIGEDGKFFFHLTSDGRLVAASAVGPISKIAKDIRFAEMLIQQQARPDLNNLENPDVKLKALLKDLVRP